MVLDNSVVMLELVCQCCKEEGLGNVCLELVDVLQDVVELVDCVVLNMVLYYFVVLVEVLKQLVCLVYLGGSLLVMDLCWYNQGWVREVCGDFWLGFEQEDLVQWVDVVGFMFGESFYIGLCNGFQIQVWYFVRDVFESCFIYW